MLFLFINLVTVLAIQIKLEIQKWLITIFLDYSILAKFESRIVMIYRKRLFNKIFIIKLFAYSHAKEELNLNFA